MAQNYSLENSLKKAFNDFYERDGMWKTELDNESTFSGIGSTLKYTESYRINLINLIKKYDIKKIFDCSCGDWNWMRHIKEEFDYYVGNDICEKIVENNKQKYESDNIKFTCNDMLSQMKLFDDMEFDLCICRHTFEHLPQNYNIDSIQQMKRISKYAILTSSNNSPNLEFDFNFEKQVYNGTSRSICLDKEPYKEILFEPEYKFSDDVGTLRPDGVYGYFYKFN